MKMDNKGITLIEIIVSIALISIVLVFLMNLFLNLRGTYNQSKIQADYDMIASTITHAVGKDIENYGILKVEYINSVSNHAAILITYNDYRPTKLSENIKKVLSVKKENNKYYLSYAYDLSYTKNITSSERITNVVRELPDGAVLNTRNYINLEFLSRKAVKIKIPFSNQKDSIYDINIYGLLV